MIHYVIKLENLGPHRRRGYRQGIRYYLGRRNKEEGGAFIWTPHLEGAAIFGSLEDAQNSVSLTNMEQIVPLITAVLEDGATVHRRRRSNAPR